MTARILQGLHMKLQSMSYIDALHAILGYRGWNTRSKPMLSGMTITGFRFTVNRNLTAESSTAYNWMAENFLAADFIGITASQYAGFSFSPTFPLYQTYAVQCIKESIDRGMAAVFWKNKFVVAVGYDDEQQALYYSDGIMSEPQLLRYSEFGQNDSPYWYVQVFEDQIELDEIGIYQESLMQAIYKWETHDPMLPESDYACGRAAYGAMVYALESGMYDQVGVQKVIKDYAAAKRDIRMYMRQLHEQWPELGTASLLYQTVSDSFDEMVHLVNGLNLADISADNRRKVERELIQQLSKAEENEELAVQVLKEYMKERVANRAQNIGLR